MCNFREVEMFMNSYNIECKELILFIAIEVN